MVERLVLMRVVPIILLILFAGLAVSPAAEAAKAPVSKTAKTLASQAELSLEVGNGYRVSVEGTGRTVKLKVERSLAFADYTTRGRASPDRIKARFGRFGTVSVRFVPSGKVRRRGPPRRCKGRPMIVRQGVFVGRIEFVGEDGYVDVGARRAKGRSSTLPRWRCNHRRGPGRASAARVGYDVASLKVATPHRRVVFKAVALDERGGPTLAFFFVATKERKGSVRIARSLFAARVGPRAFTFDRAGRSAAVHPPKPFHGEASFQRNVGSPPSWSGSLSASLPGALVELTGPTFKAKMPAPTTLDEDFELAGRPARNGG
jgi:hypothetical protein